jgi:hypothetical protein
MSWQSNDWGQHPQSGWNDGGIGGGDDRSRHMDEHHSGEWETDQGRASYDYDPSRHSGQSFGRGEYGDRGGFGGQDYGRGGQGRYGQGEYGQGQFGQGSQFGPGSFDRDRYRSQGEYGQGRGQFGQDYGRGGFGHEGHQGNYGQGRYGQGNVGQSHFGQGNYGQGNYGQGSFGQGGRGSSHFGQGDYGQQHDRRGGSFGAGISNRGYDEGSSWTGHSGRGPKGYQRSDERIREDVSDSLTDDPEVDASEITVDVRDGEVTLTGTVQSREEKRAAEACAEQVSGVREVLNQVRVSRSGSSGESSTSGSSGAGSSGRSQTGQGSQSGKGSRSSSES